MVIGATNNIGAATVNSIAAIQAAAPHARIFRAFNRAAEAATWPSKCSAAERGSTASADARDLNSAPSPRTSHPQGVCVRAE